MTNSIFKLVYFFELVLISVVRKVGISKYHKLTTEVDRTTLPDQILLGLNGVAMILPLFYIFFSWFDFADFTLPDWLRWIGVVLFAGAAILLWKTHRDLGRNWTPTLGIREDHTLVTDGIFKLIRHPMYAAHLLWAVAQPLILTNWIVGFSFLATQILQYLLRIEAEEQMMLDQFGDQYQEYMKTTGRFLPPLRK
ncbi:MAG: protein-S-isoprenylcysteine O-methyltransferase [Anaerolineales bacterium]|nr:protein-S-isoprenylcysteine O-methyltransferase [Anaerolineales bacterium]